MTETLFLTDSPGAIAPAALARHAPSGVFLSAVGSAHEQELPDGWRRSDGAELVDFDHLRRAYLEFLDSWPRKPQGTSRSFDEIFTIDGKYSVWWTSVGADRQVTHGPFRLFRATMLFDRALARYMPAKVLLLTRDPTLALLAELHARKVGIVVERLPGCAEPARLDVNVSVSWGLRTAGRALLYWVRHAAAALRCRSALRGARLFQSSGHPTVVFTSRFERYLSIRDGRLWPNYWREISDALTAADPTLAQAYLPWALGKVTDSDPTSAQPRHGVEAVLHLQGPLLLHEYFVPIRGQLAAVLRQIVASWRFFRLAHTRQFRESFRFTGTDLAPVLIPDLRDAVARVVDWAFTIGQFRCALRAAGNVRAVVVADEMYRPAMPVLAAASALGIPTIAVQHGTIMPAHLVYTLPRGHVERAPVPDVFAAYGPYAKEIISGLGAYPSSAVWITGAARLDALVNRRTPKDAARARLGLPPGKRVVVLATQTFAWFPAAIRAVLECVRSYPDVLLCVKKHPSMHAMSQEHIEALAHQIGVDVRVFDGDIELLLFASDVWISANSTTILESALVGAESICVNFSGEPDWYPYVAEGASLPARSVTELMESLAQALKGVPDPDRERSRLAFLTRHAGAATDGRAAVTLAGRIVDVCHSDRRSYSRSASLAFEP